MNKVFYLSTCSTCKRIISSLGDLLDDFEMQDIKTDPITSSDLETMKNLAGSFESLFSRKAIKYREMELGKKDLFEEDYKQLITEEYTFLKRPVFVVGERIFIGNATKNITELTSFLQARFS